ncbi:MAG: hypothetical protein O3A01_04195 [bacterium]|nr:hypothetical protein [bacterium]
MYEKEQAADASYQAQAVQAKMKKLPAELGRVFDSKWNVYKKSPFYLSSAGPSYRVVLNVFYSRLLHAIQAHNKTVGKSIGSEKPIYNIDTVEVYVKCAEGIDLTQMSAEEIQRYTVKLRGDLAVESMAGASEKLLHVSPIVHVRPYDRYVPSGRTQLVTSCEAHDNLRRDYTDVRDVVLGYGYSASRRQSLRNSDIVSFGSEAPSKRFECWVKEWQSVLAADCPEGDVVSLHNESSAFWDRDGGVSPIMEYKWKAGGTLLRFRVLETTTPTNEERSAAQIHAEQAERVAMLGPLGVRRERVLSYLPKQIVVLPKHALNSLPLAKNLVLSEEEIQSMTLALEEGRVYAMYNETHSGVVPLRDAGLPVEVFHDAVVLDARKIYNLPAKARAEMVSAGLFKHQI